jgi:hypothetical protein
MVLMSMLGAAEILGGAKHMRLIELRSCSGNQFDIIKNEKGG